MRQLANWFRRKKLDSGLDRELRDHLDRRIADFERSGLSRAEASQEFPQNFVASQPSSNSNCRLGGDFSGGPGLVCERIFLIPSARA